MQLNIEELYGVEGDHRDEIADLSLNFMNLMNGINGDEDEKMCQVLNYSLNYTVKELTKICEYYRIDKMVKKQKLNKEDIINIVVSFERDFTNNETVTRRQLLWHCMYELKNDSFMKKYVIW